MKHRFFLFFLFITGILSAQTDCIFKRDTVFIHKENKTVNAEILQVDLKKSFVQFIKTDANKYYMKISVSENLYFDRVDQLEIRSGSKSFYVKDAKQFQTNKHTGYFEVELFKNYAVTLKDEGITSLVFNKAETSFQKQDRVLIKQAAKCFYEAISKKNNLNHE